jgi:transposase
MASKRTKFTPQFKAEAVKMVIAGPRAIAQVAKELSINAGTLGNWVDAHRRDNPVTEAPLSVPDRIRLKELEAENRELRMKNEFLGKAAAFFARESQ